MTAKTTLPADETATEYPSLAAALAAFQAALPTVSKGASGQVRGNPNYKYADLADVNGAILPALGRVGLSFSAKPTLNEQGRFVLAYVLRHTSGEFDSGEYPLPDDASPQDMGSAQTYARRYVVQAVTGVAPDEDDDGARATAAYSHRSERRAPQQGQRSNGQQRAGEPAPPTTESAPPADPPVARQALEELAASCEAMGYDRAMVAKVYADGHDGADVRKATNAGQVRAFIRGLGNVDPARLKAPAPNGVPA